MTSSNPILPGAAIGVLGSGQLGRMFAIAARRMGYRVHTLSPDSDTPTGQVADVEIKASYEDLDAVKKFAKNVSVVTYEFENIPFETSKAAEAVTPVRPNGEALHIIQNRLREKTFLNKEGFPVTPYKAVSSPAEAQEAAKSLGTPAILKTAGFGYDGKGQIRVSKPEEAAAAFTKLGVSEAILEAFVDYETEFSVVAARGLLGEFSHYGLIQNDHKNAILDVSVVPSALPDSVSKHALEVARGILDKLQIVGVLCVEFFLTRKGQVWVNELAPRPHNSGHLTVDACLTSQFEQQLRAVCGLPLGSTQLLRPAAMANLLGDLWSKGEPRWRAALQDPDVKLHLYGKAEARPGRKMGHLTALAHSAADARSKVLAARQVLLP